MKLTIARSVIILLVATVWLGGCGSPRPLKLSDEERAAVDLVSSARTDERTSGREHMLRLHPDWPLETHQAVTAGEVTIGMTRDQVLAAWGLPSSRWKPLIATALAEVWRYRCVDPPLVVWFEGDTVTSVYYDATGTVPDEPKGQWGYQLKSGRPPKYSRPQGTGSSL
jgi:hypothetical protein